MTIRILAVAFTFASLFLAGCGGSTEPETGAPALPPTESMSLDLGFFEINNSPALKAAAGSNLNFLNAYVRAAYINVAIVTAITPPYVVLSLALHTVPTKVDDNSYLWVYTWQENQQDHEIRLLGTVNENVVDWELSIVLPEQEPELWFYGQSHTDRDEGFWVFRDFTRDVNLEVLRIDWDLTQENHASLVFLNVDGGSEDMGDQLSYLATGANKSIEFLDLSNDMTWDIQWNESNRAGSLRVPDYNDGDRACWDTNLLDAACAPA